MPDTPRPIKVIIDDKRHCTCCNRTNMKTSFTFATENNDIPDVNIGTICANKWFAIHVTGNRYKSADRLERKVNSLPKNEFLDILEAIIVQGNTVE